MLAAGRGSGGCGQAARALGAGSRGAARWERPAGAARPRSPEQSRRARGLATHNKKLMSAAAWAGGSAVLGLGRRGPGGKRRTQASAGCSAAAASSALLVPKAGRGGGSGKRTARITQEEGKEREVGTGRPAHSREPPPQLPRSSSGSSPQAPAA